LPKRDEDTVVIPIEDTLDLHTFRPGEISGLLTDYFEACLEKGIVEVRVVHGKGKGVLRAGVLAFLEKSALVDSYRPAGPESGGWGAVIVRLKTGR